MKTTCLWLKNLEKLELKNVETSEEEFIGFNKGYFKELKVLKIENCGERFVEETLPGLIDAAPNLEEIELTGIKLNDDVMKAVSKLKKGKKIKLIGWFTQ